MARIALTVVVVFVVIQVVTFVVYGLASALDWVQPPDESEVAAFFFGVVVENIGHVISFVLLYWLARRSLQGKWLHYACIWWLMFALGETGTAIRPGYSWPEAIGGIVAEAIYLPLAAFLTGRLVADRLE
jgi:hypothetical protein